MFTIHIQKRMRTVSRGMPGVKKKKTIRIWKSNANPPNEYSGPALVWTQPYCEVLPFFSYSNEYFPCRESLHYSRVCCSEGSVIYETTAASREGESHRANSVLNLVKQSNLSSQRGTRHNIITILCALCVGASAIHIHKEKSHIRITKQK